MRRIHLEHLLRRTEFVARPSRVADLADATRAEAVDDVLDTALNPPASLPDAADGPTGRARSVRWWIDRMATSPRPVQEKVALFWHGQLTSSWAKVVPTAPMLHQNELFRTLGLGDVRSLVHAVAIDPAMLLYLDNWTNSKESPNQNFARELMEIFTLGPVDPDADGRPNYTEADVRASAAAWTGHTLDDAVAYVFDPDSHDTTERTFLGVSAVWDGPAIIDVLLRDNTQARDMAARFIARRMWEFFAAPLPAGPNPQVVLDLATTFLDHDLDVTALVRALLRRDEFYEPAVRTGLVRTPIEFCVALAVATRRPSTEWLDPVLMAETGQVPFFPPNVAGWHANSYWVTSTGFIARAELAEAAARRMVLREDGTRSRLGEALATGSVERAMRRAVAATFLTDTPRLTPTSRAAIESWLAGVPTGTRRAVQLLTLLFLTPEFHL